MSFSFQLHIRSDAHIYPSSETAPPRPIGCSVLILRCTFGSYNIKLQKAKNTLQCHECHHHNSSELNSWSHHLASKIFSYSAVYLETETVVWQWVHRQTSQRFQEKSEKKKGFSLKTNIVPIKKKKRGFFDFLV